MQTENAKYGHWEVNWDFNPADWCGFVYLITNLKTNKKYIGKKFFTATTRKKVKNRINRKKVVKESKWKNYTGSSKMLNDDIALLGKENFDFAILSLHECRSSLAYAEVKRIVLTDALVLKEEYYNGLLPSIKYHPMAESGLEKQFKT